MFEDSSVMRMMEKAVSLRASSFNLSPLLALSLRSMCDMQKAVVVAACWSMVHVSHALCLCR